MKPANPSPQSLSSGPRKLLSRVLLLAAVVFGLGLSSAQATFHLWQIVQVYSNASGTVQFIELFTTADGQDEFALNGVFIQSGTHQVMLGNPPSAMTGNKHLLIATPGYVALSGVPPADYNLGVNNFFNVNGDTITFGAMPLPVVNALTFTAGQLPTNGTDALYRAFNPPTSTTFTTAVNAPTNFAGTTGTIQAPTIVTTLPAGNLLPTGATLKGSVVPNGSATTVHFEYGKTTAYGTSTPNKSIGSGTDPVAVKAVIEGLQTRTLYHYRVVAVSGAQTSPGEDRTFMPGLQSSDMDANGTPDLVLFNAATLASEVQFFHKNKLLSTVAGPTITAPYQLAGVADFNSDGKPDYLLVDPTTGALAVWFLDGTTFSSSDVIDKENGDAVTLPAGWQVAGVADMNADGQPDLVIFNPSKHRVAIWHLLETAPTEVTFKNSMNVTQAGGEPALVPAGAQVAGVGDFNADGQLDLLIFDPATLQTSVWLLHGTVVSSTLAGPTLTDHWQVAGVADYDSDNQPDLLLFNTKTRLNMIWYLNGVVRTHSAFLTDSANSKTVLPAGFSIAAP